MFYHLLGSDRSRTMHTDPWMDETQNRLLLGSEPEKAATQGCARKKEQQAGTRWQLTCGKQGGVSGLQTACE